MTTMNTKLSQPQIDVLRYLASSASGQSWLAATTQPMTKILGVPVKPGSQPFPRTLRALESKGLIEEVGKPRPTSLPPSTRTNWRITDAGRRVIDPNDVNGFFARRDAEADVARCQCGAEADPHLGICDECLLAQQGTNPATCEPTIADRDRCLTAALAAISDTKKQTMNDALTTVVEAVAITLTGRTDMTIGMEWIDGRASWFAIAQVRGRRLRSGSQEFHHASGSGSSIDDAVRGLLEDVATWETFLSRARK